MINTNFDNNQFSAHVAMKDYIITTSERLKKTIEYRTVCSLIYRLMQGGVTFAAKGYCISMSDVVYTLLRQANIPCKIVECQLAITTADQNVQVVGFNNLKDDPTRTDTHVVVVTETEIPMIIDVSIAHLLPNNIQGVIDEANVSDDHGIFGIIKSSMVSLTYQQKSQQSIALFHQMSIVDRIKTDMEIFRSLRILRSIVIIALMISAVNASRGFYDFYQTYYAENNFSHTLKSVEHEMRELVLFIKESHIKD